MALLANSIEGKAAPYLQRIENIVAGMESRKGNYMAECKADREDIKDIYTEAKGNGVPKKALQGLVKYRELERKQKAISDGLDIDEQSTYEQLVEALGEFGETELGKAVLEGAKQKGSGKGGTKKNGGDAPDPAAVRAATDADVKNAPAEVTEKFSERLAKKNAVVDDQLKKGTLGTEPATHTVQQ